MCILETQLGHDYLFVFGGRSANSNIINDFLVFPINVFEGDLHVREPTKIAHSLIPRELPILC